MPGKATAAASPFPRLYPQAFPPTREDHAISAPGVSLSTAEREFLLRLQRDALQFFLDNQTPGGLTLDRQSNHGPRRAYGLCSTSASGMGLIALALSSAPPYRLLSPAAAALRVRGVLEAALARLPHDHGIVPDFV